jgi:hypothetical protein
MSVHLFSGPDGGKRHLEEVLPGILGRSQHLGVVLESARSQRLRISDPFEVFEVSPEDDRLSSARASEFLAAAMPVGWFYLLGSEGEVSNSSELREVEGRLDISRVSSRDITAGSLYRAYLRAKRNYGPAERDYELRFIRVLYVRIVALWLRSDGESDRFIVLEPAYYDLRELQDLDVEEFRAKVREAWRILHG